MGPPLGPDPSASKATIDGTGLDFLSQEAERFPVTALVSQCLSQVSTLFGSVHDRSQCDMKLEAGWALCSLWRAPFDEVPRPGRGERGCTGSQVSDQVPR